VKKPADITKHPRTPMLSQLMKNQLMKHRQLTAVGDGMGI
jgi:hypothetical protein